MKIEIDSQTAFALAERFAQELWTHVIGRRLERVHAIEKSFYTPTPWIRRAVRSLSGWDRREFVGHLRHHFDLMRRLHGTEPRWQDYVATVQQHRKERAA